MLKRFTGNTTSNTQSRTASANFSASHKPIVAWNDCQETRIVRGLPSIGPLNAEKLAESVLLYVFRIALPESLL